MNEPCDPNKKNPEEVRILGIDPGLNVTGYGVLTVEHNQIRLVEAGIVRSKPKQSLPQRLLSIHQGVLDVIDSLRPDFVGLEELYSHYARPKTAIIMGHARGAICLAAGLRDIPVESYAATQVKKVLTGNGRAPKSQVQLAVTRHLGLPEIPNPPDVADAIAIGLCHFYLNAQKQLLD
ncbi:MAG: crossover junction endodeoxyribonuclease RuvC [Planctomycetota bacterium]